MLFSHPLIKYSYYLAHISYKMVDNKSKKSLIRHTQRKYITHEDKQYNSHSGSFPIVVIATFHTGIVTHTSSTFSLGVTTFQLNIPKISKKDMW